MHRLRAAALLAALALASLPALISAQGGTVSQSYMQTFDGMPSAPAAYRPPGWDVQIHSRDPQTWDVLEPMTADHGADCAAPPATHPLDGDYPSHVFQCHDHVMTSIKADGYGVIYLTPPALLDWSQGPATLQWDMSTLRTSLRDWVDVWLTPYADHLALPLENDFVVDLAGAPPTYIHLQMGSFNGESTWLLSSEQNGVVTNLGPSWGFTWPSIEATVGTPSASRRDTFQLTLRDGHLTFGMPGYAQTWVDQDVASVGFTQAVVQFGHHSYFPSKDCTVPSAGQLGRASALVGGSVLQPIALATEPHRPSLSGMGIGAPMLDVGVSSRTMRDFSGPLSGDLGTGRKVPALAVDMMRDGLQVGGVDALAVPTQMVNIFAGDTRLSVDQQVGETVRPNLATFIPGQAITAAFAASHPLPTGQHSTVGVGPLAEALPGMDSRTSAHTFAPPANMITCVANTWHWDNVSLSPAAPISITPLTPRQYTDATGPGTWTFPAPAGPDTTLQFAADNAPQDVPSIDLSWDAGATWQTVPPAPSGAAAQGTNHARSYRVPVPVDATSVQVRGQGGPWGVAWRAKDAALWVPADQGRRPSPTATVTATPTVPASSTPTPTATATPTVVPTAVPPTATASATPTPAPSHTPLPSPAPCIVSVQRASVVVATWACE